MGDTQREKLRGAAKNSFSLVDAETVFGELPFKKKTTVVDLGCGR